MCLTELPPQPVGRFGTASFGVRGAGRSQYTVYFTDVHVMGSSIHSPRCGATQSTVYR